MRGSYNKNNKSNYKHGYYGTKDYRLWNSIKNRCKDITNKNYGGRGVDIYEPWRKDCSLFINYIRSIDNYRKSGFSLDRINNNGNYEPNNLRWTDDHTQNSNRRIPKNNKTGYVGIDINQNKFRSKVIFNKTYIFLGRFDTIQEAIAARNNYIINNNLKEYKIQ